MTAKRTQREIRRTSEFENMIVEAARRLGPGAGRGGLLLGTLESQKHFRMLPEWRREYLKGVAVGAGHILALGVLAAPAKGHVRAKRVADPPPPPAPAFIAPAIDSSPPPPTRSTFPPPKSKAPTAESGTFPTMTPSDIEALTWMAGVAKALKNASGG